MQSFTESMRSPTSTRKGSKLPIIVATGVFLALASVRVTGIPELRLDTWVFLSILALLSLQIGLCLRQHPRSQLARMSVSALTVFQAGLLTLATFPPGTFRASLAGTPYIVKPMFANVYATDLAVLLAFAVLMVVWLESGRPVSEASISDGIAGTHSWKDTFLSVALRSNEDAIRPGNHGEHISRTEETRLTQIASEMWTVGLGRSNPSAPRLSPSEVSHYEDLALENARLATDLAQTRSAKSKAVDDLFLSAACLFGGLGSDRTLTDWLALLDHEKVQGSAHWQFGLNVALLSFQDQREGALLRILRLPLDKQDREFRDQTILAVFSGELPLEPAAMDRFCNAVTDTGWKVFKPANKAKIQGLARSYRATTS